MRPLLLTFLFALALVVSAQAQDPQVDPGSPAGTEYQLPVDRAREEASPGQSVRSGSGDSVGPQAPLFGAGVEEKAKSSGNPKSGTDSDPRTVTGAVPDAVASMPETVRANVPASDNGGAGLLVVGGATFGILLIGAVAGLALRRRSRVS